MGPDFFAKIRGYWLVWFGTDPLPERGLIEYTGAVTVTDDPVNGRTVVAVAAGGTDGVFDDLHVTGTTTLDGPTQRGPTWSDDTTAITVGAAVVTLFAAPMPDNSVAVIDYRAIGLSQDDAPIVAAGVAVLLYVVSGSLTVGSSLAQAATGALHGLPCPGSPSWAAGVLSLTTAGPSVTVLSASANGSGKVRLTVTGGLTSSLSTVSVTISGLTTCTEANGAHVATYVDASTFDLASVASVHTGADSGLVVLTTPPTIHWSGSMSLVVAK